MVMTRKLFFQAVAIVTLALFCSLIDQRAIAQGSWMYVTPMPSPRLAMAAAIVSDGTISVIGGALDGSNSGRWLNVNERYSPLTDSWSTCSPMPVGTELTCGSDWFRR